MQVACTNPAALGGGRATLKREQYLLQDEANAAFEKARDSHLKRGFQLMFARGADAPK